MEERYLSHAEACEVLGKSERTLYRWIKSGKLKAYKPGRDYEIPESAIQEMRERSEVYPKVQASLPEILEGEEWQRRRNVIMGLHIRAAKLHDQWAEELENDSVSAERAGEISFAIEGISHSAFRKTILGGIEQTDRADAKQVRDLMRMMGKLNALLRRTVDLVKADVFLQEALFDSDARIEDAKKMVEMSTSANV